MIRPWPVLLVVAVFVFAVHLVHASPVTPEGPCAEDGENSPSTPRRILAVGAAVVPGLVITGAGHWVNGQPCTARKLVLTEAIGLAGMGVGIPTLALTGGSQYLTAPAVLLTMGGFTLVLAAIGANLYGVTGAARNAGEPLLRRPTWETEHGVLRVDNPAFESNWLLTQRAALNLGRVSLSGALDTALDMTDARYRFGTALRLAGPQPHVAGSDGSYFDLEGALGEQRFTEKGFVTDSAEVVLTGRVDLGRLGPTLRGSFSEMSTGLLMSRTSYRIDGRSVAPDYESMLLGRVGFGVYLGRGDHRDSEAMFYYDHRRDDYAAGLKFWGYGNGMAGHVGLSARYFFSKQFGIHASYEVGSAHVFGLALAFRTGERP